MDKQDNEAYLNLIDQLLQCSIGEEQQILNDNPELIDSELVQQMLQVANKLIKQGDLNNANRLMNIAGYLLGAYDDVLVGTTLEAIDFLIRVLQATQDSNADPEVIYPLLQANLNQLNDDFVACLRNWAVVRLRESEPKQAQAIAGAIGEFSNLMYQFPLGNEAGNLEIAIAGYEAALSVLTREAFPKDWAMTQNNLGNAYRDRIREEQADNLEMAINCYQMALQVATRKAFPTDWARTQNNLGKSYLSRISGEQADNLEQAIDCFQAALQVRTREQFPEDWAATLFNLGLAYKKRIRGEPANNIEQAIDCYQTALQVYTREKFPEDWARVQYSLGCAYGARSRGEPGNNIEQEIVCHQTALQVYTREKFPEDWARTQGALAHAYGIRSRGEQADNLERAITYSQAALQVYTREAFPQDWARTQCNLAIVYGERILGNKVNNREQTILYHEETLQVYTREAFPQDWAVTQVNLGIAYRTKILGEQTDNLERAIAHHKAALQVLSYASFPEDWALNQYNLGTVYSERIEGEQADNLEQALDCCQAALEVYTRETFAWRWALTQNALGNTYRDRIRGERAENLKQAIDYYQAALQVLTCDSWTRMNILTSWNLGDALRSDNQLLLAHHSFAEAIETVELLRNEIISGEEAKQKLAESYTGLYYAMVEVCLELGNTTEAFEYIERSKTRNLVELIFNRDLHSVFPSDIAEQLQQLQNEIAVGQLQLQNSQADNSGALAQHLRALRQQRNKLQDRYLPVGSSFGFDHFQEQCQNLLDNRTAIIEWYITEKKLLAFILTSGAKKIIVWQSTADDLKTLFEWVNIWLKDYYRRKDDGQKDDWRDELTIRLETLAKTLHLDEIIKQLPEGCDRLILIPHRFLHLFPLHALPVNTQSLHPSKVLMDCFSRGVSYAPSCQLLLQAQQRKRPNFSHLFAIQNPFMEDPNDNLIFADPEVEAITSYFHPVDVYKKKEATLAAIDHAPLNTIHCTHFSCHGYFNPTNPLHSALLLADNSPNEVPAEATSERSLNLYERGIHKLDNCLTLEAIFSLQLDHCRLVTLSACETGLIDFTNTSDEYIGLPSGFLVAGSSAVVSTLWTVDDLSTAFLMIKFYETLKQSLSPKQGEIAIALNQAQQWLRNLTLEECEQFLDSHKLQLRSGQILRVKKKWDQCQYAFADPYYWAAFVATGL